MIITESELRRIIRQEILNESLSINSSEELLEEGFFKNALMALGLTAMALNPVKAKADTSIESVANNFYSSIPENCPSPIDEWWNNDISVEDYLDNVYEGEESIESYVKFFIVLAMKDKDLLESITKIYARSNEKDLPSDMVLKDMYYSPILKTKTFQNSNPDLKAWTFLRGYLIHHGQQAIRSDDASIFDRAIRQLKERSESFKRSRFNTEFVKYNVSNKQIFGK